MLEILGYLCWPLVFLVGHWVAKRPVEPVEPAMEAPPGAVEGRFLVVARTPSGARARQMFERGQAGKGETLELWDGITCRGQKGSTEA